MYINLSTSAARQIIKSDKTFLMYRLSPDTNTVVDYILTNNLSRFRDQYNNKFKLVTDIKKQLETNNKIEL